MSICPYNSVLSECSPAADFLPAGGHYIESPVTLECVRHDRVVRLRSGHCFDRDDMDSMMLRDTTKAAELAAMKNYRARHRNADPRAHPFGRARNPNTNEKLNIDEAIRLLEGRGRLAPAEQALLAFQLNLDESRMKATIQDAGDLLNKVLKAHEQIKAYLTQIEPAVPYSEAGDGLETVTEQLQSMRYAVYAAKMLGDLLGPLQFAIEFASHAYGKVEDIFGDAGRWAELPTAWNIFGLSLSFLYMANLNKEPIKVGVELELPEHTHEISQFDEFEPLVQELNVILADAQQTFRQTYNLAPTGPYVPSHHSTEEMRVALKVALSDWIREQLAQPMDDFAKEQLLALLGPRFFPSFLTLA